MDVAPPNLDTRRELTLDELARMDDPCVILEGEYFDSNHERFFLYTVAGILDGKEVAPNDGFSILGCTIGGDGIIISGVKTRQEADEMAVHGLDTTIELHRQELQRRVRRLDKPANAPIIIEGHRRILH